MFCCGYSYWGAVQKESAAKNVENPQPLSKSRTRNSDLGPNVSCCSETCFVIHPPLLWTGRLGVAEKIWDGSSSQSAAKLHQHLEKGRNRVRWGMWREGCSGDFCNCRVLLFSLSAVYPLNHAPWLSMSLAWWNLVKWTVHDCIWQTYHWPVCQRQQLAKPHPGPAASKLVQCWMVNESSKWPCLQRGSGLEEITPVCIRAGWRALVALFMFYWLTAQHRHSHAFLWELFCVFS